MLICLISDTAIIVNLSFFSYFIIIIIFIIIITIVINKKKTVAIIIKTKSFFFTFNIVTWFNLDSKFHLEAHRSQSCDRL